MNVNVPDPKGAAREQIVICLLADLRTTEASMEDKTDGLRLIIEVLRERYPKISTVPLKGQVKSPAGEIADEIWRRLHSDPNHEPAVC